jgi:serine/threonine protein kinase
MGGPATAMDNYDVHACIGTGTYGRVYDCTSRSDGLQCVLKQVPLGGLSDSDRQETLSEAAILRSVQCEHVVKYVDSWEDPESDCLYIVMEHAGDDLCVLMKDGGGTLCEEDAWDYLLQVAQGRGLHSSTSQLTLRRV